MKKLIYLLSIWIFLASSGTSAAINESVPSSVLNDLRQQIDTESLQKQTKSYQFSTIKPEEFLGRDIKTGARMALNFKGANQQIVFDEIVYLERDNVVHWLGHLDGQSNNKVIFVIEKDSLFGQQVESITPLSFNMSGLIHTDDGNLRIRPTGRDGIHIIYSEKDENTLSLSDGVLEKKAKFLEGKIKQFEFLSQLSPNDYKLAPNGTINKIKRFPDNIKTSFDSSTLRSGKPDDVDTILSELLEHYPKTGNERYQYRTREDIGHAVIYEYDQSIDGIPVEASDTRIVINKNDGEVKYILTSFFPDLNDSPDPVITEHRAIEIAETYTIDHSDVSKEDLNAYGEPPKLIYRPVYTSNPSLRLYWKVTFYSKGERAVPPVYVDAADGSAFTITAISHLGDVRVCDGSGLELSSTDWCDNLPIILDTGQTTQCVSQDSRCSDADFTTPLEAAEDTMEFFDTELMNAPGSNDVGKNGVMDVQIDTLLNNSGSSSVAETESHKVGSSAESFIRHNRFGGNPSDPKITYHEMGHAYIVHRKANGNFPLTSNPDFYENASFKEGLSDIIAVMVTNYKHNPSYTNIDWSTPSGESISNPGLNDINDADFSSNGDLYENGALIGHVFYELVTTSNNWNFKRASRLFLHAIHHMSDGGDDAIDFEDYREGMVTALEVGNAPQSDIDQVNTAWAKIGMGPFAQPTSGTTTPPSFVNGYLLSSCWSGGTEGYSHHLDYWQNVSGVSFYLVAYSLNGSSYIPSFYSATNSAETINSANVWVKVSSCQSSSCGNLSNDSYYQQDYCP